MIQKAIRFLMVLILASGCSAPPKSVTEEKVVMQTPSGARSAAGGELAALGNATEWINSPPLGGEQLRGKVVLVTFWTYTCINWLRAELYIRAWAEKYKGNGLVVVGVHTPEFEFEKDLDNVRRGAADLNVQYPIAVDSDYRIWNAFENHYWPALYFIDAEGRIRHHRFGEGEYERSEKVIQELLAEAGNGDIPSGLVAVDNRGVFAAADWDNLGSGENYVGYRRTANFASPGGVLPDRISTYGFPSKFDLNQWGLEGEWTITESTVQSARANGRIGYRFHARDLHLVMRTVKGGSPVRFRVLLDGKPPGASHGIDTDADGYGTITAPRMYQLIRQSGRVADGQFEIEFLDPGVDVNAFTFG